MDNNKFPPLEPENHEPEVIPIIPERMEPLEEHPVIEELSFDQDTQAEKMPEDDTSPSESLPEVPVMDEIPSSEIPPDEPVIDEITFREEWIPEEPVSPVAEEPLRISPADISNEVSQTQPEPAEKEPETVAAEIPEQVAEISEVEEDFTEFLETPEIPREEKIEENKDQEYQDHSQDFDKLMQDSVAKPEKPQLPKMLGTTKGRPKRKKGEGLLGIPSILVTFVWLALIVIIGVTAGRMLWICAADVLAFGREDKVVTVTVYEADTMEDIIDKLHAGGLIRYKSLFSLYADISDAEEDIKPGIYDLNTRYDYHALVNFMSPRSSREVVKLTIPEGYTCRQIFALLEENRICTAVDAAAYAANGELPAYWFLDGLERGTDNCLEGYLFPDTYEFYKNSTPREALERMLDNFEHRFDGDMLTQLEAVNIKFKADYTVREIVIIASLIEKESAAPGESPKVSGVIYNRLFHWGNNRPLLNIDATIVYAQEGQNERIDTKLDHPYNTYIYEGLTPGPIANPGLASLKAALNPESHNYYYYVLNPATGMHQFSTTYEEHQGYVREFNAAPEIEIE